MIQKMVSFTALMTDLQAESLAQFVKRIKWSDIRQLSSGDDESDRMHQALIAVQRALVGAGYDPR